MSGGLIVIIVLVVLVLWFIATYNTLVRRRNEVRNAWAQIDVQLKRRYDLIPNIVETAKGYMKHERETFEAITRARAGAVAAQGPAAAGAAEGQVAHALRGFYAVAENYPDLKANQNFLALQEELASTENKIGFARQFYNDAVLALNNMIESIPANIVAAVGRFDKAEFFEVESPEERKAPQVKF